jgi:hypothetical protein
VVSPLVRLASGPAPSVINAVHHSTAKLASYGGAIVFGLACLTAALILAVRWRRRPVAATVLAGPVLSGPAPGDSAVTGGSGSRRRPR